MYKSIVSIHGAPRSGTSWLGQIFNSAPSVKFKFQPFYSYAFRNKLNIEDSKDQTIQFFNDLYSTDEEYLDRAVQKKQGIYPEFGKRDSSPEVLALKSVKYHYLVPKFLEELDNIKIVAIIRNPNAVMCSFLNAEREFSPEWDRKTEWRYAQSRNQFRPEYYYGFHRWLEANKLFMEMKKLYPEKVYIVRYEDLFKNTVKEITRMFEFCNIKLEQQTLDFIEKAQNSFQDDVYSVFRGNRDIDEWKNKLEDYIVEAIGNDLKNTEFEQFLL